MMKLIVGVLIVAFTSYCGYFLAKKYRMRKSFFIQLYEFNERFLNELSYYRRPLSSFLKNYEYKGEFLELINVFFGQLSEKSTQNKGVYDLLKEYDFLKDDEKSFIADYFRMLGVSDSGSQKEYFLAVRSSLSEYKLRGEADSEKFGGLYVKLGFLCGLTILIVIV